MQHVKQKQENFIAAILRSDKAASSLRVQSELALLMCKGYRVSAPVCRWMRRAGNHGKVRRLL